jgi:hypothetical protein
MTLLEKWEMWKDMLPKSRLSKWAEFRLNFGIHQTPLYGAATRARYAISDYGEKSRWRWYHEFHYERAAYSDYRPENHVCEACGLGIKYPGICEECQIEQEIAVS